MDDFKTWFTDVCALRRVGPGPENFPVKFSWTVTVNVDGSSTSTQMRIYDPKQVAEYS